MSTRVKVKDGRWFTFANTHLEVGGESEAIQQKEGKEFVKIVRKGAKNVIATGDFNTDSDTTPYQLLVRGPQDWRGYLIDTYREVNPVPGDAEGTRHNFHGGTSGDRIDWIITTNNFATLNATIDRTSYNGHYPSDHFPVTAVVRMQRGSQFAGHRSAMIGGS